ncbi:MAG: DUF72 domain-containing protein [Gemmatimonadota bacterium]
MARAWVGISGWSYDGWQGDFYPEDLAKKRQLEYASRRFNSLEINGSFYSLQRPETYRDWRERTPGGFLFAVKGSRFITHNKKLGDAVTPVANFFASGVLRLEEKLGPILWQVPGNLGFDAARVESFFGLLPRDTKGAAKLARRHDDRVKGQCSMAVDRNRRLRHAIEFRHESWLCEEFVRLAQEHGVAIAFADSGSWPYVEELTAGFVYLRLHGSPLTYSSDYGDARLADYATRIRAWIKGQEPDDPKRITDRPPPRRKTRDVYVYFDNDGRGRAPWNALALAQKLEIEWADEKTEGK